MTTRNTAASPGPVDRSLNKAYQKRGPLGPAFHVVVVVLFSFDAFKADDDLGCIAQCSVLNPPVHTEIRSFDSEGRLESNAIASANIGSTHEFHVNFDGLGDTVHGHLTHDLPVVAHLFGASAFESHGRELLGVEEVRILQVSIKGFVPRVHTFDLDAHVKGWAILSIPVDGALEFIEAAIESCPPPNVALGKLRWNAHCQC